MLKVNLKKIRILNPKPDGSIANLPDNGGTTMWGETEIICPNSLEHNITGSSHRYYCCECAIWWWRQHPTHTIEPEGGEI